MMEVSSYPAPITGSEKRCSQRVVDRLRLHLKPKFGRLLSDTLSQQVPRLDRLFHTRKDPSKT